jgi:hypothetical protein
MGSIWPWFSGFSYAQRYRIIDLCMNDQPATKQDLQDLERDLKQFILEREVKSIRWFVGTFVGTQIAYFAITLTAVWFMLSHLLPLPK